MDVISQKEYLKKYLGIGKVPGEKKKKKKLKGISNRVKIIDDDAETNISSTAIEEDLQANEDAPQIVAVIDERPPSLRVDDKTKNPLWQPIGSIDSVNNISEQKQTIARFKITSKSNDKQFTHADDRSPLKKRNGNSLEKIKNNDHSPSRTTKEKSRKNKNDDKNSPRCESKTNDISPVRKPRRDDLSPSREMNVEDNSPPRRQRDDDVSPPRKPVSHDISPPRKTKHDDMSPPRKRMQKDDNSPSRRPHDDISPPRRRRSNDQSSFKKNKKSSHDGNSTPRKHESEKLQDRRKDESGMEEKMSKKMDKTLDGKTAGLQYANQLADETNELRQREDRLFKNLSKEQTGENAQTVFRDRKSGKRRNLEEEEERDKRKREEEEKNKEKYSRWGRGLVQVENRDQKMQEELYEMSKPLARYADDEDLEKFLKEQEREGDPMLQYIRNKKRKRAADAGVAVKPEFEGNYMPNRFGIKPGHRWDGVDRSNGYEKRWFEVQNAKTAQQEDVYKWSTEDM